MLEKKLPRCWRKSSPNVYKSCPKSSNSSFYMWVKFSTLLKKLQIIWASFDRTFVAKNFNLVTLVGREKNKQQMNVWGAEICKANWNFVFYLFKWGGGRQPASQPACHQPIGLKRWHRWKWHLSVESIIEETPSGGSGVAQLVERSLPIPYVRGSNPVIGKFYVYLLSVNWIEKSKIDKKRPGMAHLKNNFKWDEPKLKVEVITRMKRGERDQ